MDSDVQTWLYDILQSISEIEGYFEGKPKQFEDYVKDIKVGSMTDPSTDGNWE